MSLHFSFHFGIGDYFRFSFAIGRPATETCNTATSEPSISPSKDSVEETTLLMPKRTKNLQIDVDDDVKSNRSDSEDDLPKIDDVAPSTEVKDSNLLDWRSLSESFKVSS